MKWVVGFFLAVLPLQAMSDQPSWMVIYDDEDVTFYFDSANLKRDGNKVTAWLRHEYKIPDGTVKSSRGLRKFDCDERTASTLRVTNYRSANLAGEVVEDFQFRSDEARLTYVTPGTLGEDILERVCAVSSP